MADLNNTAAIVGAALSDEMGKVPHKSSMQHHAEAAHNALKDAGLTKDDVDAVFTAGPGTLQLAEYLGIHPRFTDSTSVGGSSFVIHIGHAVSAIANGLIDVALVTHGQAGQSSRGRAGGDPTAMGTQYESPYGFIGAPQNYALAGNRYMHEFGKERTRDAWAEIAMSTRRWAQLNPRAYQRGDMTRDDYDDSRWITYPFHLFDCCVVTDAGGAFVITSLERARDLPKKPVKVLGFGEGHDHGIISQMPSVTSLIARETHKQAFDMAGITHDDLDLRMIYDSFTYTVLLSLEDLGFCGKGEGPDFIKSKNLGPGGDFALNTSGGGLSYTHSGMYGMFLVVEAVAQLRGEAGDRQLDECNTALVHGTGGSLSSGGTTLLGVD
jgi:acetyl-CoA acetyltransferase